jgi:hypothetical protein
MNKLGPALILMLHTGPKFILIVNIEITEQIYIIIIIKYNYESIFYIV